MDFVSRLKHYLALKGISVTQFADECDIPRPTASQLLAGRNKKVSDEIIGKIHVSYPDVSVVWLMFGEGDMLVNGNIKISEPQNRVDPTPEIRKTPENKVVSELNAQVYISREKEAEKNEGQDDDGSHQSFGYKDRTFAFTDAAPENEDKEPMRDERQGAIPITPGQGKCVTGIVVYYSDSTYESFVPDPEGRHPFMR